MVDSLEIVQAANEAFGGLSMEVDGVTRHHQGWEPWQITTVLDNTKYMVQVQRAIQCHKSQLPGYGPIGEWSVDELSKVFGVGHFYRTFSLVNGGRKMENDLFTGLR
jgi:LmbE family N-acetylglucosaminyl deacetylase